MIEIKTKVRGDLKQELKFIESITKPDSIYPKILQLPNKRNYKTKRLAMYNSLSKDFELIGEEY